MINISLEDNPLLYKNYLECLSFLKTIDDKKFSFPNEKTNFHIYSEFKNDKELLSLMSYFATQNLEKTNLIVWSDYDISNEPRIQRFKHLADFRVWDAKSEAKGTLLEKENKVFEAADEKHYLQSDLLRILALFKYGGVWIDMDIVLLRDFKSILDQEYMYMWGSETDFLNQGACASVLSLKEKSEFSTKLLEMVPTMRIQPNSTCWGKDMFAKLYKEYKFTIFPSTFFNIEWCINKTVPGHGDYIEDGWFKTRQDNQNFLFLETFAWHWHNSSKKHLSVQPNSKFDLLTSLTEDKLKDRGI
jgi:hypothetical protein